MSNTSRTLKILLLVCNIKLILFNNNIPRLDLSNCKNLRYLHFFNNPICDNEEYKQNLIDTINQLPDRSNQALGSIILYPWYGLEVLFCSCGQDENNNTIYKKYPVEKWTDTENVEHDTYSSKQDFEFNDDVIYGKVVENNIEYYKSINNISKGIGHI